MPADKTDPTSLTWTNGFVLKKTRDGYSWTISIAAANQSRAALEESIETANELNQKLLERYGEPLTAKLR